MTSGVVSIGSLALESGETIHNVELAFEDVGPQNSPVILVCHALTGNHVTVGSEGNLGWWHGIAGPDCAIDTNHYRVVSFNVLGGCNGSTGPCSVNPNTGEPYRTDFPQITIRDMVTAEKQALQALGITNLHAIIGGSLGGMRVLEWGLLYPNFSSKLIPLAVTASLSDYGIAFNCIGLHAIESDPHFKGGYYENPIDVKGLEVARMAGLVTYRTNALFSERFARGIQEDGLFAVESYLKYQGKKLAKRFDPNSYVTLLRAMNSHDIGSGRGGVRNAATQYRTKVIAISFEGDLLYPAHEIESFIRLIPHGEHIRIRTKYGHDGFLTEYEKWQHLLHQAITADISQEEKLFI